MELLYTCINKIKTQCRCKVVFRGTLLIILNLSDTYCKKNLSKHVDKTVLPNKIRGLSCFLWPRLSKQLNKHVEERDV